MITDHIVKNFFTIGLRNLIKALFTEFVNRHKNLKIGYMTSTSDCVFGHYNTIQNYVAISNVEIGDYSYIGRGSRIGNTKIGKFCSIGPDVKCGLGRHPSQNFVSTHPIFFSTRKQAQVSFADKEYFEEFLRIDIGNDVWIGTNAVILDGIKIGDGAIVAACSVVTKDVPPYAIVAGAPAKLIRYRFNSEEIHYLLKHKWWDRDPAWIKENYRSFHDIKQFINV